MKVINGILKTVMILMVGASIYSCTDEVEGLEIEQINSVESIAVDAVYVNLQNKLADRAKRFVDIDKVKDLLGKNYPLSNFEKEELAQAYGVGSYDEMIGEFQSNYNDTKYLYKKYNLETVSEDVLRTALSNEVVNQSRYSNDCQRKFEACYNEAGVQYNIDHFGGGLFTTLGIFADGVSWGSIALTYGLVYVSSTYEYYQAIEVCVANLHSCGDNMPD